MATAAFASEEKYQFDHYDENIGPSVVQGAIASIVIVAIFVPLRLYSQSMVTRWWTQIDTWLIFAAAILSLATSVLSIVIVRYGLGQHALRVILEDKNAPHNAVMISELGYVLFVLSAPGLCCIKLAILTFYSRVFKIRESKNHFYWSVWAIGLFSLALGIATTVEYITACLPPEFYWTRVYVALKTPFEGAKEGTCEAQLTHIIIPLALDLVSEIAIIVLPMPLLWKLRLPMGKKIGLILAFGVGAFVTAISIIRIVAASKILTIDDFTYDDAPTAMWNAIQQALAVACACIPACAPLFRRVSDKLSTVSGSLSSRISRMWTTSGGSRPTEMSRGSVNYTWYKSTASEEDDQAVAHKMSQEPLYASPRHLEDGFGMVRYPRRATVEFNGQSLESSIPLDHIQVSSGMSVTRNWV